MEFWFGLKDGFNKRVPLQWMRNCQSVKSPGARAQLKMVCPWRKLTHHQMEICIHVCLSMISQLYISDRCSTSTTPLSSSHPSRPTSAWSRQSLSHDKRPQGQAMTRTFRWGGTIALIVESRHIRKQTQIWLFHAVSCCFHVYKEIVSIFTQSSHCIVNRFLLLRKQQNPKCQAPNSARYRLTMVVVGWLWRSFPNSRHPCLNLPLGAYVSHTRICTTFIFLPYSPQLYVTIYY